MALLASKTGASLLFAKAGSSRGSCSFTDFLRKFDS
jgi:hypothetical protein